MTTTKEKKRENSLYIVLLTHCNCDLAPFSCTHLCHISDQTQGDIRESFVKISTHHIDPREAVSCVGVCFIQSHDMSKVGKLGVVLLKAYLHTQRCVSLRCEIREMKKGIKMANLCYPLSNLLTELCGAIKVLYQMREQAENIQRKT